MSPKWSDDIKYSIYREIHPTIGSLRRGLEQCLRVVDSYAGVDFQKPNIALCPNDPAVETGERCPSYSRSAGV